MTAFRAWAVIAVSASLCPVHCLRAALGSAEEEIARDRTKLHLENSRVESARDYRTQTLSSSDLNVKEYVNPARNVVFAVTWKGSRMPDLKALLGFDPATLQPDPRIRSLHHSYIETPTLVLERAGHAGSYQGLAIRLDLMPSGVRRSEIIP